jgi:hypothetical protein
MITFWSSIGELRLDVERWGDLYTQGLSLFTAHSIVIAKSNVDTEAAGGSAGLGFADMIITTQSVGGVSYSTNTQLLSYEGAGELNATTYGRQLVELAKIVGMMGVQLL